MKTAVLLLFALSCGALCDQSTILETLVCETWKGWGQGFAGTDCSASINVSCASMFDVVPELIEFFTTFDFSKLGHLVDDIYLAVVEAINEFTACKYLEYLTDFFPHLYRFFSEIGTNWQRIHTDVMCIVTMWPVGEYYNGGVCLGHIWKVILAA